jgi:hypothetical protein
MCVDHKRWQGIFKKRVLKLLALILHRFMSPQGVTATEISSWWPLAEVHDGWATRLPAETRNETVVAATADLEEDELPHEDSEQPSFTGEYFLTEC